MKAIIPIFTLALAVALSLGLALLLNPAESCDYVNAYDVAGNISQGDYITITGAGSCHEDCGTTHSCNGETLYTCYGVTVDDTCPPLGSGPAGCVQGNNLSGHYHVSLKIGNCLRLCTCSG